MNINHVKDFGEYIGFDEEHKVWLYAIGGRYAIISANGLEVL